MEFFGDPDPYAIHKNCRRVPDIGAGAQDPGMTAYPQYFPHGH
jgi:hypothetical protein